MEEMYCKYMDGETLPLGRDKDPFWDPVEDIFLGRSVCNSPVKLVNNERYSQWLDHLLNSQCS